MSGHGTTVPVIGVTIPGENPATPAEEPRPDVLERLGDMLNVLVLANVSPIRVDCSNLRELDVLNLASCEDFERVRATLGQRTTSSCIRPGNGPRGTIRPCRVTEYTRDGWHIFHACFPHLDCYEKETTE